MSRLVNLSDSVYEELTRMKRAKNESYSEVVEALLRASNTQKKTHDWKDVIVWVKERDKHFKGKTRKIDHDLIAHGVSRDDS